MKNVNFSLKKSAFCFGLILFVLFACSLFINPLQTTAVENRPPIFDISFDDWTVYKNDFLWLIIWARDPDGDKLNYSVDNLPEGAVFYPSKNPPRIYFKPASAGTYDITLRVSDGIHEITGTKRIIVVNRPPILNPIGDKSLRAGEPLQFAIYGTDPDHDLLSYSAVDLPLGANFSSGGQFTWTPDASQTGDHFVTFEVSDGTEIDTERIKISVTSPSQPPVLNPIGDKSVDAGQNLNFKISATDPDGDSIHYFAVFYDKDFDINDDEVIDLNDAALVLKALGTQAGDPGYIAKADFDNNGVITPTDAMHFINKLTQYPEGVSFNSTTGNFDWTPSISQAGKYKVTFIAYEIPTTGTDYIFDSETIGISVNKNQPPVLTPIGDKIGIAGKKLSFFVSAKDPENKKITIWANNLPLGAEFKPAYSTTMFPSISAYSFNWTPKNFQTGVYKITFNVSDGLSTTSEKITITVKKPPIIYNKN